MKKIKKILVYNKKPEDPEAVYVEMIQLGNKFANFEVKISVCDKNGKSAEGGDLCTVTAKGVFLHSNIDPKLGFPLDEDGKLKIDEGE
jgi:hypothetical protein